MGRAEGSLELFKDKAVWVAFFFSTLGVWLFSWIFNLFTFSLTKEFAGFTFLFVFTIFVTQILAVVSVNEFYESAGHWGVKAGQGIFFAFLTYILLTLGLSFAYNYLNLLSLWWIMFLSSWIYFIILYLIAIAIVVILWD